MAHCFEDKMTDIFKSYICMQNGHWVDVSMKQAIIYGAGQGCLDFMNEMSLPNVSYIIDSDENKWNKEIELLNVRYKVQSPLLLLSLKLEYYYIIISSNENEKSIKASIEMHIGKDRVLICNRQAHFFCYKRIEDLLYYDPLMKRKILLINMSFAVENVISIFKSIIEQFKNIIIDRFIPLREGESKLAFLFGNEMELWVFSIPGYHNGWEKMGIGRDSARNKRIRWELKKRINIDKSITVYEDERGILIQKYAGEYIDFSRDEIKRTVLDKCRRLHQINEVMDIRNDMIEYHYINLTEKVLKRVTSSMDIITDIKSKMKKVVEVLKGIKYEPRICHCDLFCTNVVCYKGDLFFIDWEYMAMSDPMFDVCRFLFSMGLRKEDNNKVSYKDALRQIYEMLRRDICIYFERECTKEEYLHAFLVMLIFECRELYVEALFRGFIDAQKAKLLIDRIDNNVL